MQVLRLVVISSLLLLYHAATNYKSIDHETVILGYGTDESTGIPYWIGMNSWRLII